MRKFERGPEPQFLAEKWEAWGREWESRKMQNPSATFNWRQIEGAPMNQRLLPLLKAQTQDHCSFCDNFPVSPPSIETIEHFRPKARFPRDAYKWANLYFCCDFCQQKSDDFEDALLCPDALDYEFDRYFRWDYTCGKLQPNEKASTEDQYRAYVTINIYRLNEEHPRLRMLWSRRFVKLSEEPIDSLPYRNYIMGPTEVVPSL